MKVTVARKELLEALGVMARVAPNSTTSTIYKCVLLQADGDKMKLSAQDESIGADVVIPAQVSEPGMIAVPAKGLQERIALLPEADVTLACQGDEWQLQVTCRKSEYNVHGLPGETFPENKEVGAEFAFSLPEPLLKEMIRQVIFAVADDSARPALEGVCFVLSDGNLRLVATDTHQMAIRDAAVTSKNTDGTQVIVPAKALSEVLRILSDDAEKTVHCRLDKNLIQFATEKSSLFCRLVDQQYPRYERVLPKEGCTRKLTMTREDFIGAVKRMTSEKLLSEKTPFTKVIFRTELGSLYLRTQGMDGRAQDEIECELQGEDVEFGCKAENLLEGALVLETEKVCLEMTGPLDPIIIKGHGSDVPYLSIAMPTSI